MKEYKHIGIKGWMNYGLSRRRGAFQNERGGLRVRISHFYDRDNEQRATSNEKNEIDNEISLFEPPPRGSVIE
jgi:hypothetical protein